jgi:xylose dehydrogenase (NAD/NADP)
MDTKLRWGVLSTARIGVKTVIPAITQSKNGTVAALASRNLQTARQQAEALGIPHAFGSYEEMLASPLVDAVYNPLPNSLHKEWTVRAAEHGKHILVEKPIGLNTAEADEMIASAQKHHVLLAEAFMYRFHPQWSTVKSLISRGALGRVQILRSAFTFVLDDPTDIRLNAALGGGSLMDLGCYCVNMFRLVTGAEPVYVQANAIFGERSRVDETFAGTLRFPDDVIAGFDCSFRAAYREWLSIAGTNGRIDMSRPVKPGSGRAEFTLQHADDTIETITTPGATHYQLMVEDFADAVLHGQPLRWPAEDSRANMRVIDALFESARTGKRVDLAASNS